MRWTASLLLVVIAFARLAAADAAPVSTTPATPGEKTGKSESAAKSDVIGKPGDASGKRVACIVINDAIDDFQSRFYRKSLKQAIDEKYDAVVVHLTTDGGYLHSGTEIMHAALSTPQDHPRLIIFIDNRAWSAGALIAYSHDEIYLSSIAKIGDIGIITIKDGQIEYLPEKIESPFRADLRAVAKARGWNTAKLVKMTARNQELYRFSLPGGNEFVIEDDLPQWLADHPAVKTESKIVILGKDRLMSYTADEAVKEGMATGVVKDLAEVYAKLGVTAAQVKLLEPTQGEVVTEWLAGFAPLLAAATVLFVILEFKMPSGGLFLVLAAISGVAFFACQFSRELAGNLELVTVAVGVGLIAVELFWLPTGGMVGFAGLMLVVIGLVLAFMPDDLQFSPNVDGFGAALGKAMTDSILALAIMTGGLMLLIRKLPDMKAIDRIAATAEITGTSAGALEQDSARLIGRRVMARTELRPSGYVAIDDQDVSATTEHGQSVAAGAEVEIVVMRLGEVVVRPVAAPPAGGSGAAT